MQRLEIMPICHLHELAEMRFDRAQGPSIQWIIIVCGCGRCWAHGERERCQGQGGRENRLLHVLSRLRFALVDGCRLQLPPLEQQWRRSLSTAGVGSRSASLFREKAERL